MADSVKTIVDAGVGGGGAGAKLSIKSEISIFKGLLKGLQMRCNVYCQP